MRYTYKLKELAKELCEKSGCHHKCNDTTDCVVEDEALLLINENKSNNSDFKSNNFDVKSNEELFKQALVEGVNRHIDKAIAEIKVVTYEQDRLNHFIDRMEKAQKKYDRLYKRYKDSPYLSEGTTLLSDAGRKLQFYKDVIAMLEQDNRKQSENVIELPCKVGDKIFFIHHINDIIPDFISDDTVTKIGVTTRGILHEVGVDIADFGKTVFLTKEEAENALAKMKGGEE